MRKGYSIVSITVLQRFIVKYSAVTLVLAVQLSRSSLHPVCGRNTTFAETRAPFKSPFIYYNFTADEL